MNLVIRGSAELALPPLASLDASSAEGLRVDAWAGRPARLARMDRLCALGLVACDAALRDAGLSPEDAGWRPERTGVVLGTRFGCHATNEAYYRGQLAGAASPRLFAYTLPSSPVGEIGIHLRVLGPASTQVAGLTAAIDALCEAARHLALGRADRVLVAAADVATPTAAHLGGGGQDVAAALVIEPGEAPLRVRAIARRFVADDPEAAAREAAAALDAPPACGVIHADAALHAAGPLQAIRRALRDGRAAIVVASDPSGLGAAVALG